MFQQLWEALEEAAGKRSPESIAKKNGFARSTWFDYRNHGTIPFNILERLAASLKVKLYVALGAPPEVRGSTDVAQEGTPLDYGKKLAALIEDVPPEQQEAAFGAAFIAAREAIRALPFDEPAAGGRASRRRSTTK